MITATVADNLIEIAAPFASRDALKAISGARWSPEVKRWIFPATPEKARELYIALAIAQSDKRFDALLEEAAAKREATALAEETPAEQLPDIPSKTRPWPHQKRAFWKAAPHPGYLLALAMGAGKTLVAIALANYRECRNVLVLSPKSAMGVWPREFLRHSQQEIEVCVLDRGRIDQRLSTARAHLSLTGARRHRSALVVNHEAIWRDGMADWALDHAKFDAVIFDESHRGKAADGKLGNFMMLLGERVPLRLCLTGTPLPHSALDAFAQYRFLDQGVFGTSWHRFRRRYAVLGGYQNKVVVGYQNTEEFEEKLHSLMFRVTKEQAELSLPEFQHIDVPVKLGEKGQKVYDSMARDFFAEVEQGVLSASSAAVKVLRLQQITSGHMPVKDMETGDESRATVDVAKRDALADLLPDLPGPVVIFCRFTHDLDTVQSVCNDAGLSYGEISGRRKDLTPHAQMPAGIDVMGVIIQAGGVGIDLTRASEAIYYSLDFNLANYEQSLARLHRPGQTRHVTYRHLVAERTVDETIYLALRRRADAIDEILRKKDVAA
ncbi:MAG: DEAD/DEAH box helicase [Burkholderiaceae bacterium]